MYVCVYVRPDMARTNMARTNMARMNMARMNMARTNTARTDLKSKVSSASVRVQRGYSAWTVQFKHGPWLVR